MISPCASTLHRSSVSIIIDKAMDAGTPLVFFNREPAEEDMNRGKAVLCGRGCKGIGGAAGDALVDAYRKDSRTLDANGNGLVSYVLRGETSHQDSHPYGVVHPDLEGRGVPLEKITGDCQLGQEPGFRPMEQRLKEYPGR
ncbi:hypothetical protein [Enterocloster sp.]|uniref:hypothetical protein n=1 Tax=Enterocloster sp. TaxID=2719315 RepID=UPI00399F782A